MISGVSSGVGKSLVGLGLAVALRKRNVSLSCAVVGADLFQAILYNRISGRYVRCIDDRILASGQILRSVQQSGVGADLVMIEGRAGLYDGSSPGTLRGADAEIAALTQTPVVLVVDGRGFGSSVAALVKGYNDMASRFSIAGAILNRIDPPEGDNPRDRTFYAACLEALALPPLLGALPELATPVKIPRGTPSERENKTSLARQFFVDVGNLLSDNVDIDRLLEQASYATDISLEGFEAIPMPRRCRIAVSSDSCFALRFEDNLELLRHYGAEIVPFSPLADVSLPKRIGAVYLTGAYMAEYGAELAANTNMKKELKAFGDAGGAIYSEGGGTAYLCKNFRAVEGAELVEGVGLIPGNAVPGPGRFAYHEVTTIEESILGRQGLIIKGVTTDEWRLSTDVRLINALRSTYNGMQLADGYSPGAQIIATFGFAHWGSNPEVARNFADAAEVVQKI